MRGSDIQQPVMFSYMPLDEIVSKKQPLREIREMVDFILERMDRRFGSMYSTLGRPSIPPEKIMRVLLLQILYSVRSERLLMDQLKYNMLFKWFVGLNPDDEPWDPTVLSKNRERFLRGGVARRFFREVVALARNNGLLSAEHFTVDGTPDSIPASLKSFQPRGKKRKKPQGRNPSINFHGERRSNKTHQSITDPEAILCRKGPGKEALLSYLGNALTENRNGLVVDCNLVLATGTAEREAAMQMLKAERTRNPFGRITVGADKGYDVRSYVDFCRKNDVTPHVASRKRNRN